MHKLNAEHLAPLIAYLRSCDSDDSKEETDRLHRLAQNDADDRGSIITEDIAELYDLDPSDPWFSDPARIREVKDLLFALSL